MPLRNCCALMAMLVCCGSALGAAPAAGAGGQAPQHLDVAVWSVVPFVGLLLCIALLPLVAGQFWHANRHKALVAVLFSLPVVAYLLYLEFAQHQPGLHALEHAWHEYVAFIILLGALYTIAGGIVVDLNARPGPLANGSLLAVGAVLGNLIGTTGASMLLVRPFLRINQGRQNTFHLPVFFIFMVSNLGGLLTPLGDPPLFLGFLRGVDFFWTMQLWPQWLVANGLVLMIFLIWDALTLQRERGYETQPPDLAPGVGGGFGLRGAINFVFLLGILLAVLLQSTAVSQPVQEWLAALVDLQALDWPLAPVPPPELPLKSPWPEMVMVAMALLSLLFTSRTLRRANVFSWGPIVEVAVLFVGIFLTMIPALELLKHHGREFGISEPWQYFWLTGGLSSFLDNAPTYLTFGALAVSEAQPPALPGLEGAWLELHRPRLLAAISCGAVFMGANTYIGNGPNFMVKAIAEEAGYRTPSFFGYLFFSCLILLPIFALISVLFFS